MGNVSKIIRKIFFGIILIPVIGLGLAIFSSFSQYKTDVLPPPSNASPEEVFPGTIDGKPRTIETLSLDELLYKGFRASFGASQEIQITVVQCRDEATADQYFKDSVVPQIKTMPNNSSAKINGRWFAKGTDNHDGRWYGWVNRNWVFLVFGMKKALFYKAIDEFPYISR